MAYSGRLAGSADFPHAGFNGDAGGGGLGGAACMASYDDGPGGTHGLGFTYRGPRGDAQGAPRQQQPQPRGRAPQRPWHHPFREEGHGGGEEEAHRGGEGRRRRYRRTRGGRRASAPPPWPSCRNGWPRRGGGCPAATVAAPAVEAVEAAVEAVEAAAARPLRFRWARKGDGDASATAAGAPTAVGTGGGERPANAARVTPVLGVLAAEVAVHAGVTIAAPRAAAADRDGLPGGGEASGSGASGAAQAPPLPMTLLLLTELINFCAAGDGDVGGGPSGGDSRRRRRRAPPPNPAADGGEPAEVPDAGLAAAGDATAAAAHGAADHQAGASAPADQPAQAPPVARLGGGGGQLDLAALLDRVTRLEQQVQRLGAGGSPEAELLQDLRQQLHNAAAEQGDSERLAALLMEKINLMATLELSTGLPQAAAFKAAAQVFSTEVWSGVRPLMGLQQAGYEVEATHRWDALALRVDIFAALLAAPGVHQAVADDFDNALRIVLGPRPGWRNGQALDQYSSAVLGGGVSGTHAPGKACLAAEAAASLKCIAAAGALKHGALVR
ncbi:hypothetical protein HXX76_004807 [Chlamydomonas incerta]|uniref:Uncharacterized protein n=1 Tax=Chlamydomonas incerta TaxID=51695 RepID=A0A835W3Q2_CHLIN|nr:hypothetical protein HXX76_004807 [Chlamydomonas incerta]|eukprot:KAG2439452.1 hypothetical protein HXX76_004807 [Chlamydomonas incerta]